MATARERRERMMPRRAGNEEIAESMREEEKRLIAFSAAFLSALYHPHGAEGTEPRPHGFPAPAHTYSHAHSS